MQTKNLVKSKAMTFFNKIKMYFGTNYSKCMQIAYRMAKGTLLFLKKGTGEQRTAKVQKIHKIDFLSGLVGFVEDLGNGETQYRNLYLQNIIL